MARIRPDPLAPSAMRAAFVASTLVLLAAAVGGAIRVLPWVLDPTIAWGTLAPFAKSLVSVGIEAAVLTGWPVGWAVAAARLVDRGEARVLASLGEPPSRTVLRLAPQGAVFALALALTSLALGRDAAAPGRVVDALLAEGRAACLEAKAPETRGVPFVSATWLCDGGEARLVGRSPLGEGVVFTASDARVSDDLRRIDLDDARLAVLAPVGAERPGLRVRVRQLTLRGLAPWARASALPPALRALIVTLSAASAALAAVYALLRIRRRRLGAVAAVALGASGPLGALAVLRALEVRVPDAPGPWLAAFAVVPLAATAAVAASAALAALLPAPRRTGTK